MILRPIPILVLVPCYTLVIMLLAWAGHELGYDRWIDDAGLIYRVETTITPPGAPPVESSGAAKPLPQMLQQFFGESVLSAVSIQYFPSFVKSRRIGGSIKVHHAVAAPSALALLGRGSGTLPDTNGVMISRELALTLFGHLDVIGQTLYLGSHDNPKHIVALLNPAPGPTHFPLDVFEPSIAPSVPTAELNYWFNLNEFVYLKTTSRQAARQIEQSLPRLLDTQLPPIGRGEGAKAPSDLMRLRLLPITDIHLHSHASPSILSPGDRSVVVIALGLALLAMLFAAVSYNGYAMSGVVQRSLEIGIRKLEGASSVRIFTQIAGGGIRDSLLAVIVASGIVVLITPMLTGDDSMYSFRAGLFTIVALAGIVAMLVNVPLPAWAAMRATVLEALRGQIMSASRTRTRIWILAIQVGMTVCALLVTLSLRAYVAELARVDYGFNIEGVSMAEHIGRFHGGQDAVERIEGRLIANPGTVARSSSSPTEFVNTRVTVKVPGTSGNISLVQINGDNALGEVLGLRLQHGHWPRTDNPGSGAAGAATQALLSLSAADLIRPGNPGALVGTVLLVPRTNDDGVVILDEVAIAGIVDDLRFGGPKAPLQPVIITNAPAWAEHLLLRTTPAMLETAQSIIQDHVAFGTPAIRPFTMRLSELTASDRRALRMSLAATLILMLTAAVGFWGAINYLLETRRKDIAIHRIMGAGAFQVIWNTSAVLLKAVTIASVLGALVCSGVLWLVRSHYEFPLTLHPAHMGIALLIMAVLMLLALTIHSLTVRRGQFLTWLQIRHE